MGCKKCEELQASPQTSLLRFGNATIEIRACEEHLKKISALFGLIADYIGAEKPQDEEHAS